MRIIFLIIILPFCSYSQVETNFEYSIPTYENAADEIYADIKKTENWYLIPYKDILWLRADGIVCLSGIRPIKWDHHYSGISFKPTFEEISKWKNWFKENKQNIHYSTEPVNEFGYKTIVFEYEKGKFRRNDCLYPK